jgi:hypothetical protein
LRVNADHPGSQILLDGKSAGTAPLKASVPVGRHLVEAKSSDGLYGSEEVVVHLKQATDVAFQLKPLPGQAEGATPSKEDAFRPYADLRAVIDPFSSQAIWFDVGGGIQYRYLRAGLAAIFYPDFGFTLRGALGVPVAERFNGYLSMEIPILFSGSTTFGLGGAAGMEYEINHWFAPFLEIGLRHYFNGGFDADPNRFVIQSGIRLRSP